MNRKGELRRDGEAGERDGVDEGWAVAAAAEAGLLNFLLGVWMCGKSSQALKIFVGFQFFKAAKLH